MPRGNPQNLRVPTSEQARKYGRLGGKKSAANAKARKTLKEELLALLSDGDTQSKVSLALIQQALLGNVKAFETIRDTIGQKPVDVVQSTNVTIDLGDMNGD